MPRWTEETTQAMLRLRDAGHTFHYIGGRLGFSPDYVRRKLRETAPATVRQRLELSDEEAQQLNRLLDAGMDCRTIAATMDRSLSTVKHRAAEYRAAKGIGPHARFEWTAANTRLALYMRKQGHVGREIAETVGCSMRAIYKFLEEQKRAKAAEIRRGQFAPAGTTPPRTIINSAMREPLKGTWTSNRPGAMDYARIPSRGIA